MKSLIELMDIRTTLEYYVNVTLLDALDAGMFPAEREAALGLLKEIRLSALQGETTVQTHAPAGPPRVHRT